MATRYSTLHHEMKALAKAQGYKVFMKDIRLARANEDWSAADPAEAPKTPECEAISEEPQETPDAELKALEERHSRNESALLALNHFEAELYKLFPLDPGRVTPLAMELAQTVGKVKELINGDDFEIIRTLTERITAQPEQPAPRQPGTLEDYDYTEGGLYIKICEGTGDNLLPEDEENGYCDYLMYYVYEDREALEAGDDFDGGMLLLDKLAVEQFSTLADAVPLVNGMVFS